VLGGLEFVTTKVGSEIPLTSLLSSVDETTDGVECGVDGETFPAWRQAERKLIIRVYLEQPERGREDGRMRTAGFVGELLILKRLRIRSTFLGIGSTLKACHVAI
jgi:hypothetical protein